MAKKTSQMRAAVRAKVRYGFYTKKSCSDPGVVTTHVRTAPTKQISMFYKVRAKRRRINRLARAARKKQR